MNSTASYAGSRESSRLFLHNDRNETAFPSWYFYHVVSHESHVRFKFWRS